MADSDLFQKGLKKRKQSEKYHNPTNLTNRTHRTSSTDIA
jgi:hypothetical protein